MDIARKQESWKKRIRKAGNEENVQEFLQVD